MDDTSTEHHAPTELVSRVPDLTSIPLRDLATLGDGVLGHVIRDVLENSTGEAISGWNSIIW